MYTVKDRTTGRWKSVGFEEYRLHKPRAGTHFGKVELFAQRIQICHSPNATSVITVDDTVPPVILEAGSASCMWAAVNRVAKLLTIAKLKVTGQQTYTSM